MRVLLYDVQANRYLQSPENWTVDPSLAADLGGTVRAVNFALQHRLSGVEIILSFDEAELTMRLPLDIKG